KYKKTYVQKTKGKRIPELIKWEKETNDTIDFPLHEQIMFQKDLLGYVDLTLDVPKSHFIVTEADCRFTPRLTFYQLATGKEYIAKIKKDTFLSGSGKLCSVGDYVEIIKTFKDYKWKRNENGKFYQDKSEKELFVGSLRHIK